MQLQPIRIALKEQKMTYEDLSKKSNVPLGTIKRIMSGVTPDPRESTVRAIERALGLNLKSISIQKSLSPELPPEKQKLLNLYDQLSFENRIKVITRMEVLLESQEEENIIHKNRK